MKFLSLILLPALAAISLGRPSSEPLEKRLVQFSETGPAQWLTITEVDDLATSHVNFMDVTDLKYSDRNQAPLADLPTAVRFQSNVQAAITKLSIPKMEQFLTHFSSYHNRYYTTATGVASSEWLLSQLQEAISTSGYVGSATAEQYVHSAWAQRSVIARIQGTNAGKQVVVLGAHLDSVTSGAAGAAPGADDNGTGSTCILAVFRALLESGFIPKTTIEFQWYAAEEVGLRGSQAIATNYRSQGIEVVAMVNFDMVGYLGPNKKIAFITDYTNAELNTFLRKVVDAYNVYGWVNSTCGYACSDHASWYRDGVRAAFPHEDNSNPHIHTIRDTLQYVTFNHINEFAKLGVGFAIEVAEPSTA